MTQPELHAYVSSLHERYGKYRLPLSEGRKVIDEAMGTVAKRTSPKRRTSGIEFEESTGNVFADLGLLNPERELLKARLTLEIYRIIKERNVTQAQAGVLLGIKQPHVSLLMRNRAGSFSVERLMDFLTALGQDIEITVRPTRKEHGAVSIVLA